MTFAIDFISCFFTIHVLTVMAGLLLRLIRSMWNVFMFTPNGSAANWLKITNDLLFWVLFCTVLDLLSIDMLGLTTSWLFRLEGSYVKVNNAQWRRMALKVVRHRIHRRVIHLAVATSKWVLLRRRFIINHYIISWNLWNVFFAWP